MKKINLIILISGLATLLVLFSCFVISNTNLIKRRKFINILENIIKTLIKNKDIKLLNSLFDNLINLKRIQYLELVMDKGLRITKNKILNKKAKILKIEKEIYEENRYYGTIKIDIIV